MSRFPGSAQGHPRHHWKRVTTQQDYQGGTGPIHRCCQWPLCLFALEDCSQEVCAVQVPPWEYSLQTESLTQLLGKYTGLCLCRNTHQQPVGSLSMKTLLSLCLCQRTLFLHSLCAGQCSVQNCRLCHASCLLGRRQPEGEAGHLLVQGQALQH